MHTRAQNRAELAGFLRSRREALSPGEVGLPVRGRRRTPGLRRDEVAELASMSTTCYERLEQERGPQPSPAVLAAIARSLQLNAEGRQHPYLVAGQAPPPHSGQRGDLDAVRTAPAIAQPLAGPGTSPLVRNTGQHTSV
jgi:hypothetical protein